MAPESNGTGEPWHSQSVGTWSQSSQASQHRRASALEHLGTVASRIVSTEGPESRGTLAPWFRRPAELRVRGTLESWRLVLFKLVAVDDQLCKLRLEFPIAGMHAQSLGQTANQGVDRDQCVFNLLRGRRGHVSLQKILTDEKVRCEVIIRLPPNLPQTPAAGRTWTAPTPVTPSRIEKLNHRWWS